MSKLDERVESTGDVPGSQPTRSRTSNAYLIFHISLLFCDFYMKKQPTYHIYVYPPFQSLNYLKFTLQASLKERCDAIVSSFTDELNSVAEMLATHHHSPPQHKNMPPVTSKLCWLHALRERITWPMDKLREVAAELLEGDKGWSLRHIHGQLLQEIEQ